MKDEATVRGEERGGQASHINAGSTAFGDGLHALRAKDSSTEYYFPMNVGVDTAVLEDDSS